jgi:hypothetical protein
MLGGFGKTNFGQTFGILFSVLFFVLFFRVTTAEAIGLSPPQIMLGEIESGETHFLSMNLVRGIGEIGDMVIAVEKRGGHAAFVQGEETVTILSDQRLVAYNFVFSPEITEAGDYELKIDFFPESEPSDDLSGSAGVTIRAGITGVVTYSIASISGGGGGSSSPHRQEEETPIVEEPEVSLEIDEDEIIETESIPEISPTSELESDESESQINEDLNEDEQVDLQEIETFFQNLDTNNVLVDFNHDGIVNAQDLSIMVFNWTSREKIVRGLPPVVAGPPTGEDKVTFRFQLADKDTQKFDVILASTANENIQPNNYLTFYLLVDTGVSGINATDLEIQYDPKKLKFIQSNIIGSVFDVFPSLPHETEAGHLNFLGATTESFIGTNGFLATFDFEPISDGETNLDFLKIVAFRNEGESIKDPVSLGLSGIIKKNIEISSVVASQDLPAEKTEKPESRKKSFFIWLFIIILILDFFTALVLYRHKKIKKI